MTHAQSHANTATLHIINHALIGEQLKQKVTLFAAHDGVIFIQDGVYSLLAPTSLATLQQAQLSGYAIEEDLSARNIDAPVAIQALSYEAFVDLSLSYKKTITWSQHD